MKKIIKLGVEREKRKNTKLSELIELIKKDPQKAIKKITEISNGEATNGATERENAAYFLGYLFSLSLVRIEGINFAINSTMKGFASSHGGLKKDYDYWGFM